MIDMKAQAFGLELEFSGITRRRAAQAIAQVLNGNASYTYEGGTYKKCTVLDSAGRKWLVEYDSSIRIIGDGEQCEFVTPKCTYDDIPKIQECIRALRKAGAKVNSSCGLHIHIDGANHNAKSLKNLVFTFRAKEDLIFKAVAPDRKDNHYCKPIDATLVDSIKRIKKLDDFSMKDAWYTTYYGYGNETTHYHDSRYHALNLHSLWYRGTVEFRLFRATLHAGEVRAYLNLCLAMSAAAINAKRASAEVLDNGNDKYAMRCYLLRLGFIGDEWKTVREHLLKNLEGNAAWRNDPNTYESYRARRSTSQAG
jgi:hypothetical protein